ncbi:MAG: SAM-dependent methyltransferase [Mariprofundaceae bacterium]
MSVNTDMTTALQNKLQKIIKQRIDDAGGTLSFESFMHAALYEPELGYYESAEVFGEQGDFVTGVDLGQWLAMGFADVIAWGLKQLGQPDDWCLLEQGGGSGRLLFSVFKLLNDKGINPPRMIAIEASIHMRERQRILYAEKGMVVEQYATLSEFGTIKNLLMFCNELPDAFPVRSFIWKNSKAYERVVAHCQDGFCWQDSELISESLEIDENVMATWPDGYISEWNPGLVAWQQQVSAIMGQGYLFCVDYGYTQQEYYRAQRAEGTLMGHCEHQVVEDVLANPGTCDVTAHVDFTSLRRAGEVCGLKACAFISQGGWLAQSPSVQAEVQALALKGGVESMQALAHAKRMMLPFGLGESFKLLIQTKERDVIAPDYLRSFDHLHDLCVGSKR